MEWFANLPLPWVAVIVIVLLAIRFALKRIKTGWAKNIGETAESLALAFALVFFIIRPFVVQAYYIPSESMEPGLLVSDHLIANKAVYHLRGPKHGEIVVFKAPPAAGEGNKDFIKRCIGTPGDTIQVKMGYILINGRKKEHRDVAEDVYGKPYLGEDAVRVKFFPDHIIVGDRNISKKQLARDVGVSDATIIIKPGVVLRNGEPLDEPYTNADPDYDFSMVKVPANEYFMMGDNRNNSKDSHYWGFLDRKYVEGKAMFLFWPIPRIRLVR